MSHYFTKKQDSEENLRKIRIKAFNELFELYTAGGIFSKDGLDNGSRLLIENSQIKDKDAVLDFGCGNGVVGVIISKKYSVRLIMSDVNERAVKIADMNMKLFGLKNAKVVMSDVFSDIKESFDVILLNPPQTAGKALCFRMIEESKAHLNEEGSLQLVARHKKGGEVFENKMLEVFGNVSQIAKGSGFRVYLSKKE